MLHHIVPLSIISLLYHSRAEIFYSSLSFLSRGLTSPTQEQQQVSLVFYDPRYSRITTDRAPPPTWVNFPMVVALAPPPLATTNRPSLRAVVVVILLLRIQSRGLCQDLRITSRDAAINQRFWIHFSCMWEIRTDRRCRRRPTLHTAADLGKRRKIPTPISPSLSLSPSSPCCFERTLLFHRGGITSPVSACALPPPPPPPPGHSCALWKKRRRRIRVCSTLYVFLSLLCSLPLRFVKRCWDAATTQRRRRRRRRR